MDKILVACTNNLLRSRVNAVLARFPDIKAVFEFSQQAVYQVLNQNNFRLVILQDCLGDSECLELVDFINTSFYSTQLLILTCSPQTSVKIKYLELGADDCLAINFHGDELFHKIKKMLCSQKIRQPQLLQMRHATVFPLQGVAQIGKKRVGLRKREVQILECLYRHRNTVVSRQAVIASIWRGREPYPTTVDSYIRRIRRLFGKRHHQIETIWGYGYRLNA